MPLAITSTDAIDKFLGIIPLSNATLEYCKNVAQHYYFKAFKTLLKWNNIIVCNLPANQSLLISLYGEKISKASIYYNDNGSIYKYQLEINLPTQLYSKNQVVSFFNRIKSNLGSSGFVFKNNKIGPRDIYSIVSSGKHKTTVIGLERFNEKEYRIYISANY